LSFFLNINPLSASFLNHNCKNGPKVHSIFLLSYCFFFVSPSSGADFSVPKIAFLPGVAFVPHCLGGYYEWDLLMQSSENTPPKVPRTLSFVYPSLFREQQSWFKYLRSFPAPFSNQPHSLLSVCPDCGPFNFFVPQCSMPRALFFPRPTLVGLLTQFFLILGQVISLALSFVWKGVPLTHPCLGHISLFPDTLRPFCTLGPPCLVFLAVLRRLPREKRKVCFRHRDIESPPACPFGS